MTMTQDGGIVLYDADRKSRRECGDCQLCCRLVPVRELDKPALQRCKHQKHGVGCTIHATTMPFTCGLWECLWLKGEDTGPRPDRAHLVVDPIPDFVRARENDTGVERKVGVRQVWIDPAYPLAHRAPAFRRWAEKLHREFGFACLIRYGSHKGFLLIPPAMTSAGKWIEYESNFHVEPEHSPEEVAEALHNVVVAGPP